MGSDLESAVVLIPAYNPDEKLLALLPKLKERFKRIVLVDDGSVTGKDIFEKAVPFVEKILVHEHNRGKGAALKTGFAYVDGKADVITADADGQHTPEDIAKIAWGLRRHAGGLVLGVRLFEGDVPFRSRFGNFWTRLFFYMMSGLLVHDTQTGLRGIPASLLARVAALPGDRYEYEMAMLADARNHPSKPLQIPIRTVYLNENATSHFNPIIDSLKIYRSLVQFCVSSILGFALDNLVYVAVMFAMASKSTPRREDILIAYATARLISAHFNYFYNRFVVFRSDAHRAGSYIKYFGLVICIFAAGYALTATLSALGDVRGVATTAVKLIVETVLFVVSYFVQKKLIFNSASAARRELSSEKLESEESK